MYTAYWQLDRRPFEPAADGNVYYPSETHQGALLKLRYAVENRRGGALLSGPSGSGKTMLVGILRRQLDESFGPVVHLVFPQMNGGELVAWLADEVGAPGGPGAGASIDQTIRRLEQFFVENSKAGRHAVVAVDEAQLLYEEGTLETIRLLLNFEADGAPCLTLLLVGEPTLLPALSRMPALDERLAVKTLLRPFAMEETISYINHRLTAAGAKRAIFDNSALEAAHYLSHGIARKINRLCDLALLVGYAEELPLLSAEHLESVCDELVAVAPE